MAETQIYINDNYTADTSTKTVVQYVEQTIEAAKSDIIQDIRPEIDNLVDESLSEKMGRYSLTNHTHTEYALVSETYSKQEVDLKVETSIPDLSPYATKDELQNYSIVSHTHDYALSSDTYSKQEVNDIVNSHVPDLSDYATKEELQNYSSVSHQHSDYALAENVYTKSETENLVNSHTPDLSSYYTKSETDNLISGFKRITFLTTDEYEALDPKDESVLYILTDSEETPIDLSSYVTIEQLNARGYKTIQYISTADYEALDPKDESVLYILTDSEEETIDLTSYYTKSETDTLISGFKNIQYLTTEAYNALENKDPDVLYILTDSQEEEIDLSSYYTKDEIDNKGFKKIEYITTEAYNSLDPKDPSTLYILTDSQEETIDLSQFSLTNHQHADYVLNSSLSDNYYTKSYIDTSLNDVYTKSQVYTKSEIDTNYYDSSTVDSMLDNYYDKTTIDSSISEINSSLSGKQDSLRINDNAYLSMSDGLLDIHMKEYGDDGYYQIYLDNEVSVKTSYRNADDTFSSEEEIGSSGIYSTMTNTYDNDTYVLSNKMTKDGFGGESEIEIKYDVNSGGISNKIDIQKNYMHIGLSDENREKYAHINFNNGSSQTNVDINANDFTWNGNTVVTRDVLDSSISTIENTFANYYTKSYIDTSLNNVYTKSEIDTTLAGYSLTSHTHNDYVLNSALNDYYNKTYIDTSLNDVYTKSYIDTSLNNVYTKSEIDTMIGNIETSLASI